MRRAIVILVLAVIAAACGADEGVVGDEAPTATTVTPTTVTPTTVTPTTVTTTTVTPQADMADMMAAALMQLITENHTFGEGPPPFSEYLIQTRTDPFAGDATGSESAPQRDLTEAEQEAIEPVIAEFGPVRWIDDPEEWRTPELSPVIDGSAILGVGEPSIEGDTGLVPVSLWCGGLCGTWLTYRLDFVDGAWAVTDIEGPIAVS